MVGPRVTYRRLKRRVSEPMTDPPAESEIALSNVRRSIHSERRFPQNVFTGAWNEFLFFDSDWMRAADFVEHLKELLSAENGRCAAVVNLDRTSDDRERSPLFVHMDTTPNEYQILLGNPGVGTGWLVDLDRLACASNTGEWSMYCEPATEIAVVGFRQTLSQDYRQVLADSTLRALRTQSRNRRFHTVFRDPHCHRPGVMDSCAMYLPRS